MSDFLYTVFGVFFYVIWTSPFRVGADGREEYVRLPVYL